MATALAAEHSDFRSIAALLAAQDAAWARGDAEGFCAHALPDISFTNIVGKFSIGKAPFVAQHAHIFATFYKGTTLEQRIERIAAIAPDVAIVDAIGIVSGVGALPDGIVPVGGKVCARPQQILVRAGQSWAIAAFHNVSIHRDFLPAGLQ